VIVAIESHQGAFDMQVTTIGLDIAKNVFQVHGIDAAEKVVVRKQLRRSQVLEFFKALLPCLVGIASARPTLKAWSSERSAITLPNTSPTTAVIWGIPVYYTWSKEFLEAGKRRLAGDTARAATSGEVKELRRQAQDLKEVVAEQALELRLLKKSMIADGGDEE